MYEDEMMEIKANVSNMKESEQQQHHTSCQPCGVFVNIFNVNPYLSMSKLTLQ